MLDMLIGYEDGDFLTTRTISAKAKEIIVVLMSSRVSSERLNHFRLNDIGELSSGSVSLNSGVDSMLPELPFLRSDSKQIANLTLRTVIFWT
jgi:hypothetical protein